MNEIRFRVRYAETDQMGVVYHANYLVWMEMGRVELCRSLGVRYRDLEAQGILLTVAEANCRFLYPARYDDEVSVTTDVKRSTTRLLEFEYSITAAEGGRTLATGTTTHVFCSPEMKPCRLPERYWKAFGVNGPIAPRGLTR